MMGDHGKVIHNIDLVIGELSQLFLHLERYRLVDLGQGGKFYATAVSARKWLQMWADVRAEGLVPDADTTAAYGETGTDNSALVAGKEAIGLIWSNQ